MTAARPEGVGTPSETDPYGCERGSEGDGRERLPTLLERQRQLRSLLERALGEPLASLTLTRNRSRIASARPESLPDGREGLAIRVHRCFVHADDGTVGAIAAFFTLPPGPPRRAALHRLRQHYREHAGTEQHGGGVPRPRRLRVRTRGRHHDLLRLRDRLNRDYFGGELDLHITWGRGSVGRGSGVRGSERRGLGDGGTVHETLDEIFPGVSPPRAVRGGRRGFHIRLGSYHDRDRLVRIHPVLDRADVPERVVESIVYHEMLHAALPPIRRGQRRSVHHPEFRRRERLYAHHEEARAWIAENVERLARERW